MASSGSLTSVGLFAGIGGLECGLERAGFATQLLCELDGAAQSVLAKRFPGVRLENDVRELASLPRVDLLSAGFPCQDLSQAGRTAGIGGKQSGLVEEIFRLVADRTTAPTWLLLENVSFMLRLNRGAAMEHLATRLEQLGFAWAYRVVDSRAFGVPQRRQRVILLASRTEDPRPVLFGTDGGERHRDADSASAFGFYWTEGRGGLGWAVDAVPTLKGGSTIGIASPPAIWRVRDGMVFTPDIRDAERMQGFPADWTDAVGSDRRALAKRWKLVGNAVTTSVAEWVGRAVASGSTRGHVAAGTPLARGTSWPVAAWGAKGERQAVDVSMFPRDIVHPTLAEFLRHGGTPLSARATNGFLQRARAGSLRFRPGFLDALDAHYHSMLAAGGRLPSLV